MTGDGPRDGIPAVLGPAPVGHVEVVDHGGDAVTDVHNTVSFAAYLPVLQSKELR